MTEGTSFRELINHATGKSNASRDEFESSMAAKGYRASDIRKLGKAYERISGSGNEYILHPEKGFNVFDKTGAQKEGSGKKKGNKAGSDLGDLIGLGNDVSLLAGALRHELPGLAASKAPTKTITPEPIASTSLPKKEEPVTLASLVRPATPGAAKKVTKPVAKAQLEVPLHTSKETKLNPQDGLKKEIKGTGQASSVGNDFEDQGFDWQKALLGDLPLLWDMENYKDLGALFNPARIWSDEAASWSDKRLNARAAKNKKDYENQNPGESYGDHTEGQGMGDLGVLNPIPFVKGTPGLKSFFKGRGAQRLPSADIEENFLNNLTEDLSHVQHKKGGKLPMARYGMLFNNPALNEFGGEQDPSLAQIAADGILPGPGTQEEFLPGGSEYREKSPQKGGNGGNGYGDVLSGLVKYGIPAAYLGAEQNQIQHLRSMINPHLEAPELMVGAVQDLPRPDFSLPYQPGLEGSSSTEAQNAGLAREKFTRDRRNDFELRNALNRQAQKNAIIDRTNQASIQRAGVGNQEKMIKSSNAFNEFAYLMGDRGVTAGSLFQNLDQGIYGAQVSRDARSLSHAQEVVRNPERYPNEQGWARKTLSGYTRHAKGGKLNKSLKFSKKNA